MVAHSVIPKKHITLNHLSNPSICLKKCTLIEKSRGARQLRRCDQYQHVDGLAACLQRHADEAGTLPRKKKISNFEKDRPVFTPDRSVFHKSCCIGYSKRCDSLAFDVGQIKTLPNHRLLWEKLQEPWASGRPRQPHEVRPVAVPIVVVSPERLVRRLSGRQRKPLTAVPHPV